MNIEDVTGKAIHYGGRCFIDCRETKRRYVVIKVLDPFNMEGGEDDWVVARYAEPPDGFPEDGWLSLDEG